MDVSNNSEEARLNKQKEAEMLLEKARKAAEEAEKAQQKAASLKGSELDKFAEFARKYSKEKQIQDLKNQAESKAGEAARLAAAAEKAERERGTTTLAQKYAEKSREAILEADDAERRIATSDFQHHAEAAHDYALTYEAVIESLKDVRLVPVTGSRTDISRTTDALDDLKTAGKLQVWNRLDAELGAMGFRGGNSLPQLLSASKTKEGSVDVSFGVSSYKALQVKNSFSGALLMFGGLGLIFAGYLEKVGALSSSSAQTFADLGYGALLLNIASGFFGQQVNDWLVQRFWQLNYDDYKERALVSEAAHLMVAYMCGLPVQEYRREYIGYPLRTRPTGRAQVFSSRRGDPEVVPRNRPLGLPPWASLESEIPSDGDMMFGGLNPEPIRNGYTSKEIDHLSLTLLAGPVAEYIKFGGSINGALCFQQLDTCMLMSYDVMQPEKMQGQARWAIIKLMSVLTKNKNKLSATVEALRREESLVDVIAIMESTPN
ncbi:hypothetical protein GUITHDRAFT_113413 [Guillardia theta CCMP2712]|uniref:Uncharacterized protein n=1 Tax=Guillardia theta (strain CCMP2712) TaxID=905079 RepID=L1IXQ8_GUITC|nr:hypothetical protein GUITHDRAFT_113413 [Guillardia theta CCMP2712]EKX40625.1 hypothetical protein GUITHDRAFT_113413 [Guillardia theta CCMP2712]|eukprot:XP_005827605.1 hypothetical protein GUITHDRAFT_113413 [Guillardia theta CCMP2712]